MDRPPSPLFRPLAVEAASGTQIGAALMTHWRGVPAFTAAALALLATLVGFVAIVEHAPVHRVAAFVDARGTATTGSPVAPDDSIVVRLLVPPAAVASVRLGSAFRLAFRAYPQERFGLFGAEIQSVDDIASLRGGVPPAAADDSAPTLVATAVLPATLHGPQGQVLALKPGMLADALVPGERRTVLAWLLESIGPRRDDGARRDEPVGEARR